MLRRLFFAIPAQSIQHALIECQTSLGLTAPRKIVPPANFHLTLHFLGATDRQRIPELIAIGDAVQVPAFTLTLNQYGVFPKARCVWLGPTQTPKLLHNLVDALHRHLTNAGWFIEPDATANYRPHITLCRHMIELPTLKNMPLLPLNVHEFQLYESISTLDGVIYEPLACWQLQP
jgi:2'-5' RNA ligase